MREALPLSMVPAKPDSKLLLTASQPRLVLHSFAAATSFSLRLAIQSSNVD